VLALGALAWAPAARAQGTGFTYQGRLADAGAPANGSYDLECRLYDAASGGGQVGPTLTLDNVAVSSGLFTVTLDFGAGAFIGAARWLALAVRPGASTGAFTPLSPRQALTPAPGAVFSATAGAVAWAGVTGKPPGFADGVDNDSGGTMTSVTAGTGLSGGTITSTGTLSVDFGGSGSAASVSRSDHDHDASYWKLNGNAGTTPGTDFLGTSDFRPLDFRVGMRALRLEPRSTPNVIGGFDGNATTNGGVRGAFIGGGGSLGLTNLVSDDFGTVAGGANNRAGDGDSQPSNVTHATVGGGAGNWASAAGATVAGGASNWASAGNATVGGGNQNIASGLFSAVGGGQSNDATALAAAVGGGQGNSASGNQGVVSGGAGNIASGGLATVPGGVFNTAGGNVSFAAGNRAKVRDAATVGDANGDEGTFAWADSTEADFTSTGPNQFLIRAGGGVGINTNQPGGVLDLAFNNGAQRLQFRHDSGLVPGINLTGTGTNLGILRLRRRLEIWPNDAGSVAGGLDLRNTSSSTTINLDGTGGSASFNGDVVVDAADQNNGTTATPFLRLGASGSGEGVRSPRSGGHVNQYGLEFLTNSQARMAIKLNGNVGIGTNNPGFQLQLSTDSAAKPTSNTWTISSDARLKKDVRPLDGALHKLLRLRGVTYRWIDPASQGGMDGTYMGLIAQDVEPVFPEWVKTGADGFKTLTVSGFEGLAAEALRQLREEKDAQLASQRAEIAELRARLERLEALLAGTR
jgi:hypothetical protein